MKTTKTLVRPLARAIFKKTPIKSPFSTLIILQTKNIVGIYKEGLWINSHDRFSFWSNPFQMKNHLKEQMFTSADTSSYALRGSHFKMKFQHCCCFGKNVNSPQKGPD